MILNVLWGPGESLSSLLCVQHLLDTWLSLWQWVFQPAIGVLMLGAVSCGCLWHSVAGCGLPPSLCCSAGCA